MKVLAWLIPILMGIVLTTVVVNLVVQSTTISTATDETVTITLETGQTTNLDVVTTTAFSNATVDLTADIGGAVNVSSAGVITTDNTTINDGAYNISYTYEAGSYVDSTLGRTIVGLIATLYAVGIIVLMFKSKTD